MKRWALLIGVVAAAFAGCGEDSEPAVERSPAGSEGAGESRSDLYDRARADSRVICESSTPREIAGAYGGEVGDPSSLAQAYATESYVPDAADSAEVGCLEGLAE